MKRKSSRAGSSRSANSRPPRWLLLGNFGNRRVALFQSALRRLGQPPARDVEYRDVLRGEVDLSQILAEVGDERTLLRIESPAEDHEVERRLIARGADDLADSAQAADILEPAAALRLRNDVGRVRYSRQWFAGFSALLGDVERLLAKCPGVVVQNHPRAIRLLFDKPRCHAHLAEGGVPVAPSLPGITSYDSLREAMQAAGWNRVFVKLATGSSASGVVAFSTAGTRPLAVTSLELVRKRGELRFYNNLRLSHYSRGPDLRAIVDFLCREGAHVEQWLPKAVQAGRNFDLRVVTFAGRACHTVVRSSRSPLTNLHLGNRRGDLELLKQSAGRRWDLVIETCEAAARAVPEALYVGWDVLVTPGFRRAVILEGNAFGDLLPGVLHEGHSTHERGIAALHEMQAADC